MIEILETEVFTRWMESLRDAHGRYRIQSRLNRLRHGNYGEYRENIADGVSELIFKGRGPGYRIYYTKHGEALVLLLCGGTKSRQQSDIATAVKIAREFTR